MQSFRVTVNGKMFEVTVEETNQAKESGERIVIESSAVSETIAVPAGPREAMVEAGDKPVTAPLGGTIMSIKVKPGQQVKYGQVLVTLEALKMENEIVAPEAGTVKEILVSEGSSVKVGDVMVTLRP